MVLLVREEGGGWGGPQGLGGGGLEEVESDRAISTSQQTALRHLTTHSRELR